MLTKRLGYSLCFLLLLGIFSLRQNRSIQADALLQDFPRLDGKNIYFTEASREASRFDRSDVGLSRFAGLLSQLGANLYTLEWRTPFPTDADMIVIAGPVTDLTAVQTARLWAYMNNRGRVLLLANAIAGERGDAFMEAGALFTLMWTNMTLRGRDDVVIGTVDGSGNTLVDNFVTAQLSTTHPITQGMSGGELAFFAARSLDIDLPIGDYQVEPLVFSTDQFYGESDVAGFGETRTASLNIGPDTTYGALPLAAAFWSDATAARIVLVGDREFATNGGGLQTSPPNSSGFLYPGNVRFLLNSVTWLLEAPPVDMQFPTPAATGTATITPTITPTFTPTPGPEATEEGA
jgi:hypothetical protein